MLNGYAISPSSTPPPLVCGSLSILSYSPDPLTSGSTTTRHPTAKPRKSAPKRLTGYLVRRRCGPVEEVHWSIELPGFGLRCYPSGKKRWIVRYTERGKQRVETLGSVEDIGVAEAHRLAKERLRAAMLLGLPQRLKKPAAVQVSTFAEVCDVFLRDRPFAWSESTEARNVSDIRQVLMPEFGHLAIDEIRQADVHRWNDGMASRPGRFNRAVPTLSAVMVYAEQLGKRKLGSNPTKGLSRYPVEEKQRFLETAEYARLDRRLAELDDPVTATAILLLIHTGARCSEIGTLRWTDVNGNRLELPKSKTGRKTILLSNHARELLDTMPKGDPEAYIFARNNGKPLNLSGFWTRFRSRAGLPDVRLHDLRHSYVSIAVQNGFDLEAVGRLLGHLLPETTSRYAHLSDASISEAAELVGSTIATMLGLRA